MNYQQLKITIRLVSSLVTLGLFLGVPGALAGSIYDVNRTLGTGGVVGTIETDGTIGALVTSNVIDWSLTLDDGVDAITITPLNSSFNAYVLTQFSATATELLYGYAPGTFFDAIIWDTVGLPEYYAWVISAPAQGGAVEVIQHSANGIELHRLEFDIPGIQTVGTLQQAAVPVPAAIWLLSSGLLVLIGIARRRKVS